MRKNPAEMYQYKAHKGSASQVSNTTDPKILRGRLRKKVILSISFGLLIIFAVITLITILITRKQNGVEPKTSVALITTTAQIKTTKAMTKSTELTVEITESITVKMSTKPAEILLHAVNVTHNTTWTRNGSTIAGDYDSGNNWNQLDTPLGMHLDDSEGTVYIADRFNHRVMAWRYGAERGSIVAGALEAGNRIDHLNEPLDLIIDPKDDSLLICDGKNRRVVRWSRKKPIKQQVVLSDVDCYDIVMDIHGHLYVSDMMKHEVKRWEAEYTVGRVVAGGNGKGDALNQFNVPAYMFVDDECSIYVADYHNHRVTKWLKDAKEGIVVAGGGGKGTGLTQLNRPLSVVVDRAGNVYVADNFNHRVVRWLKDANEGSLIVGTGEFGAQADELWCPSDLTFDRQGNLYVVDQKNHRVQKFDIVLNEQ